MLYRRSYDGILLHCLLRREEHEAFKEAHDGMCRAHQPGPKLWEQLRRLEYYWPKTISDAIAFAKQCHDCQSHGDFIHQSARSSPPNITVMAVQNMGNGHHRTHQPAYGKRASVHISNNQLLLKTGRRYPLK